MYVRGRKIRKEEFKPRVEIETRRHGDGRQHGIPPKRDWDVNGVT